MHHLHDGVRVRVEDMRLKPAESRSVVEPAMQFSGLAAVRTTYHDLPEVEVFDTELGILDFHFAVTSWDRVRSVLVNRRNRFGLRVEHQYDSVIVIPIHLHRYAESCRS